MKLKIWQIALVSTSLGFGLPALAQIAAHQELRSEVETSVKERLGRMDANHDGVVTRAEMDAFMQARIKARADERFAALDTDRNGSISRAEFEAGASHPMRMADRGMMPPPGAPNAPPPGGPGGTGGMHRMGMMMHGGPDGPSRGMMMAKMGDDGQIVIADVVKKALDRFDAIDTNKDGTISPEERKAAHLKWRETKAPPAL